MLQRIMPRFLILLAGFLVIHSVVFLIVDPNPDQPTIEKVVLGLVPIAAAGAILAGLYLGERAPWPGAGLLIGGTLAMAVLWYWIVVISVPILLLVTWFATSRARCFLRETRIVEPER